MQPPPGDSNLRFCRNTNCTLLPDHSATYLPAQIDGPTGQTALAGASPFFKTGIASFTIHYDFIGLIIFGCDDNNGGGTASTTHTIWVRPAYSKHWIRAAKILIRIFMLCFSYNFVNFNPYCWSFLIIIMIIFIIIILLLS